MLEKFLEQKLVRCVRAAGGLCLKWSSPGAAGVPDRIVLLPGGRLIFVEMKRPKGGRLSKLQKWWAKRFVGLGFDYDCIWDEQDLQSFVETELGGGQDEF